MIGFHYIRPSILQNTPSKLMMFLQFPTFPLLFILSEVPLSRDLLRLMEEGTTKPYQVRQTVLLSRIYFMQMTVWFLSMVPINVC